MIEVKVAHITTVGDIVAPHGVTVDRIKVRLG